MQYALRILLLVVAATSVSFSIAIAQEGEKTKRVGIIVWSSPAARGHLEQALLDELRSEGYVEGKNLVFERRYIPKGGIEEVRKAANELASLRLDAVVSTCSPSTAAMRQATLNSGTPVVMAVVADPVGQELVASLSRPGGNVTGLSSQGEDVLEKMLDYLSAVVPKSARVAVLFNTTNPVHPRLWRKLEMAGKARDVELVRVDVAGREDLAGAIDRIARERLGALLVLPDDNMTYNSRKQLVELVAQQRLPAIFGAREFVVEGGLMSYGENMASSYRRAAVYLDKILKGVKPASLPVEQPTRFELVINLKAAAALGVTIPLALRVSAIDVINE